jgi:hypothetical protein
MAGAARQGSARARVLVWRGAHGRARAGGGGGRGGAPPPTVAVPLLHLSFEFTQFPGVVVMPDYQGIPTVERICRAEGA